MFQLYLKIFFYETEREINFTAISSALYGIFFVNEALNFL